AERGGRRIGQLVERRGGLLGNHERVPVAERADVEEGEDRVVLVDPGAGNLAAEDPAEDRVRHLSAAADQAFGDAGGTASRAYSGFEPPRGRVWSYSHAGTYMADAATRSRTAA